MKNPTAIELWNLRMIMVPPIHSPITIRPDQKAANPSDSGLELRTKKLIMDRINDKTRIEYLPKWVIQKICENGLWSDHHKKLAPRYRSFTTVMHQWQGRRLTTSQQWVFWTIRRRAFRLEILYTRTASFVVDVMLANTSEKRRRGRILSMMKTTTECPWSIFKKDRIQARLDPQKHVYFALLAFRGQTRFHVTRGDSLWQWMLTKIRTWPRNFHKTGRTYNSSIAHRRGVECTETYLKSISSSSISHRMKESDDCSGRTLGLLAFI